MWQQTPGRAPAAKIKGFPLVFFYATCPILNWNKLVGCDCRFIIAGGTPVGGTQFMPEPCPHIDTTVFYSNASLQVF